MKISLVVLLLAAVVILLLTDSGSESRVVHLAQLQVPQGLISETTTHTQLPASERASADGTCEYPSSVTAVVQSQTQRQNATVLGFVSDRLGEPVTHAYVAFVSAYEQSPRLAPHYFAVSASGQYRGELLPGLWVVSVALGSPPGETSAVSFPQRHPLYGSIAPLPKAVSLLAGEERRLDFTWGGGECIIQGTVRDQYGEPFSDIQLVVFPSHVTDPSTGQGSKLGLWHALASTKSDQNGRYSFPAPTRSSPSRMASRDSANPSWVNFPSPAQSQ